MPIHYRSTEDIATRDDARAARAAMENRVVYERRGAGATGDVRLTADGEYVVSGSCTLADVERVNPLLRAEVDALKVRIAALDPREPGAGESTGGTVR